MFTYFLIHPKSPMVAVAPFVAASRTLPLGQYIRYNPANTIGAAAEQSGPAGPQ